MQANLGIPLGSSRDSPIFVLFWVGGGGGDLQKEQGRRQKRDEDRARGDKRDGDGYVFKKHTLRTLQINV